MKKIIVSMFVLLISSTAAAWDNTQAQSQNQAQSASAKQSQSQTAIAALGDLSNNSSDNSKTYAPPSLGIGSSYCSQGWQVSFLLGGFSKFEPHPDCLAFQTMTEARATGHPEVANQIFYRLSKVQEIYPKPERADSKESRYNKITGDYADK